MRYREAEVDDRVENAAKPRDLADQEPGGKGEGNRDDDREQDAKQRRARVPDENRIGEQLPDGSPHGLDRRQQGRVEPAKFRRGLPEDQDHAK